MPRQLVCALCLLACSVLARAQSKEVQIPRIARPPKLEDFLNGQTRSDMRRIDDFRQRQPGDGIPSTQRITAFIGYDATNFYAVFLCEVPPGRLRARLSRREDLFNDDLVAVFLDTYHDHQRNYEFFLNPYGVQADGISTDGSGDDTSFDTLWSSQTRILPEGFLALFSIPFRSLRFSAAGVQTWGFGLGRFIPYNNESSFWPYITQKVDGFSTQLGTMTGLENISAGRNLQLTPYGTFGHSHFLDEGRSAWRSKTDVRAGVDVKAVLRDSLTLDLALNPDFSQVESNDPQVTVNQRFEVQFPEKRPFFLENNNYFSTPENLFFSRRIVDPEFGARLTGKIGRWNLGALAMDDRAPGRNSPRGGRAAIGVFRLQRDFGKQSNVGALFTDREFDGGFNRVGALDLRFKPTNNWLIGGQAIASHTLHTDGRHDGGSAYVGNVHWQNRDYSVDWYYTDRAEGFHTGLGFVPRVDMRQGNLFAQRRFHPKSKWLLSWGPYLFANAGFDHHNVHQDRFARPAVQFELARSTFGAFGHARAMERFQGINFLRRDTNMGFHTEYFKRLTFDGGYSTGTRINYDAPKGSKPFLAAGSEWEAQITVRPVSRMKIEGIYYLTRLRTMAGEGIFTNHLARSRLNYQFTRAWSLRMILDYNSVLENPRLINLTRQKRITGDVLLTYLVHPGTAIYAGYTDRLENLALGPGNSIVRTTRPYTTIGRQFFMKASYLFRF